MMQHSSTPWWRTDAYDVADAMPARFLDEWSGPKGPALVRVWPDGRTDKGWGLNPPPNETDGFMPRYLRGEFNHRRVLYGYGKDRWSFAFVMRSMRLVALDIDGKNGGLEYAKRLGMLPPTLAETSKSGNGYHLFYLVDEEWTDDRGFGLLGDRIGIEQGVDFRATGCVYHHRPQRWNRREPALLPDHLLQVMQHREQKQAAQYERILKILTNNDDLEVLMLHDEIISELNRPIAQGKRNQTLFAIGNRMREAQVPGWEQLLLDKAAQVGLPDDEANKLVANIDRYALTAVAP
jgi:hypothetical protein